jgi:membrane-bound serine protease (ClpP class)
MTGLDPFTWAIILMLIGCALVVLEVFIPSGGILGMLSGFAILGSIIFAFRRDPTAGMVFVLISLVAVPTLLALAFRVWPHTPMGKAFLGELPSEDELKPIDVRRELVGRAGVAKTMMLPSGSVLVDGHWLDAISQGDAIEPGEPIVVVEVRANRVVVRRAEPDETQQISNQSPDILSKPLDELDLEGFEDEPLG